MKRIKTIKYNGHKLKLGELINIYHTQDLEIRDIEGSDLTAWVYSLDNSYHFYSTQKKAQMKLKRVPNILQMIDSVLVDDTYRVLLTEKMGKTTLLDIKNKKSFFSDNDIIQIALDIAKALKVIHEKGFISMSVNEESILYADQQVYKMSNLGLMISAPESEGEKDALAIVSEHSKSYDVFREFYPVGFEKRLEQSIDLYSMGILLYYLCYSRKDIQFDSLHRIQFPEEKGYNKSTQSVIQFCIDSYTNNSNTDELIELLSGQIDLSVTQKGLSGLQYPSSILGNLNIEEMKNLDLQTDSNKGNLKEVKPGFVSNFTKFVSKMTSQTQGWILCSIDEILEEPDPKYTKLIIMKTWKRPEKVAKFCTVLEKLLNQQDRKEKSIVVLKTLLLLHNYLKKGPNEVFTCSEKKNKGGSPIILRIIKDIHEKWKDIAKFEKKNPIDRARSRLLSYYIYLFSLVLQEKTIIGEKLATCLLGNFSIEPFLSSQDSRLMFSSDTLRSLLEYAHKCILALNLLKTDISLKSIQVSLLLCLSDEIYNVVSTITHLIYTFKMISNHLDLTKIDREKFTDYIKEIENAYDSCMVRFNYTLTEIKNSGDFRIFSDLFPYVSLGVVSDIRKVPFLQGYRAELQIEDYLRTGFKIGIFEIPSSYGNIITLDDSKFDKSNNLDATRQIIKEYRSNNSATKSAFNQDSGTKTTRYALNRSQSELGSEKKDEGTQVVYSSPEKRPSLKEASRKENFNNEIIQERSSNRIFDFFSPKSESKAQQKPLGVDDIDLYNPFNDSHLKDTKYQKLQSEFLKLNLVKDPETACKTDMMYKKEFKDSSVQCEIEFAPISKAQTLDSNIQCKVDEDTAPNFNDPGEFELKAYLVSQVTLGVEESLIDFEELQIAEKIAGGSTCEVFRGNYKGLDVAIKRIKIELDGQNKTFLKEFKREMSALLRLRPHPNILSLLGVAKRDNNLYLVTEFCFGGSLFEILHKKRNIPITWEQRRKIISDIAKGMIFLHKSKEGIIHRDLKSLNLLIDRPLESNSTNFNVKIADFGLAKTMAVEQNMTAYMGTFHWMAPEILNNQPYSFKADVYSFAIVIWEILARVTPFNNLNSPHAIMKYVSLDEGRPDLSSLPQDSPKDIVCLMIKSWNTNPDKRPTFQEILKFLSNTASLS